MKVTTIAACLLGALSLAASGSTVVFGGIPTNVNRIQDNTGATVGNAAGAVVTAGRIDGGTFVSLVGTNGSTNGTVGISAGSFLDGLWNGQTSNTSGEANAFDGQPIAVLVQLSPTEFAVYTTSVNFLPNGGGLGDSVDLSIDTVTGVDAGLSAPGSAFAGGVMTVGLVPEPSTSLLAGLAGLALLIRRKR